MDSHIYVHIPWVYLKCMLILLLYREVNGPLEYSVVPNRFSSKVGVRITCLMILSVIVSSPSPFPSLVPIGSAPLPRCLVTSAGRPSATTAAPPAPPTRQQVPRRGGAVQGHPALPGDEATVEAHCRVQEPAVSRELFPRATPSLSSPLLCRTSLTRTLHSSRFYVSFLLFSLLFSLPVRFVSTICRSVGRSLFYFILCFCTVYHVYDAFPLFHPNRIPFSVPGVLWLYLTLLYVVCCCASPNSLPPLSTDFTPPRPLGSADSSLRVVAICAEPLPPLQGPQVRGMRSRQGGDRQESPEADDCTGNVWCFVKRGCFPEFPATAVQLLFG